MEERDPPPIRPPPPPPSPLDEPDKNNRYQLQLPDTNLGTYVVQVPKDQIYRVPPPENARLAELYRTTPPKDKKGSSCFCCVLVIIFLAIVVIIGCVLGGLFSMVLRPKDPRFSIKHLVVVSNKPHPKYNITLQVFNPNTKVGILYKEGGDVSFALRRQEIASGTYPTFFQAHENTKVFSVALKSSKGVLPKEVEKSKMHVPFSLTIRFPTQMKMGLLHSGTMKFDVTCQVTMSSLAKTGHVLSQHCQTKQH